MKLGERKTRQWLYMTHSMSIWVKRRKETEETNKDSFSFKTREILGHGFI